MRTLQTNKTNELLEPEELEFWEARDFDDVLPHIEELEQENEPGWNISFGLIEERFH